MMYIVSLKSKDLSVEIADCHQCHIRRYLPPPIKKSGLE